MFKEKKNPEGIMRVIMTLHSSAKIQIPTEKETNEMHLFVNQLVKFEPKGKKNLPKKNPTLWQMYETRAKLFYRLFLISVT